MKRNTYYIIFIFLLTFIFTVSLSRKTLANDSREIKKTIKIMFNSIRYGKYNIAVRMLDFTEMSKILLKKYWNSMAETKRREFTKGVETIVRKLVLKESKKKYKHFSNILYSKPRIRNGKARCKTNIIVYRNYKKKEHILDFSLVKKSNRWKIVDVYIIGEGTLEGIYEDEVEPLIKEGGVSAVMKTLREKIRKLSN